MNACEIITQDLEHLQQSISIHVLLPQPPTFATHLTSIWNTNTVKCLSQLHSGRGILLVEENQGILEHAAC